MIDPIALRKKLSRRNIGPKHSGSMENALQAVQEREAEVVRFSDPEVREDRPPVRQGILSAEELAYCLHNFAMQWEVPGDRAED